MGEQRNQRLTKALENGGGESPSCRGAISKLESCGASIVNRGTLSPLAISRQFGEEVGQLKVATLAPEASDAVASGPSAAGAGDAQDRGTQVGQRWEPSRGMAGSMAFQLADRRQTFRAQSDRELPRRSV